MKFTNTKYFNYHRSSSKLRVIAAIKDPIVINKILKHTEKLRLYTKTAIRYQIPVVGIIMKMAGRFPDPLHIAILQTIEHNRKLGVLSVPKSEILSL